MESIENVLTKSVRAIETMVQQCQESGGQVGTSGKQEGSLSDLISILTNAKAELNAQLELKRVVQIKESTIKAINTAIEKMMLDPTTEHKINAIQLSLFGTRAPFWKVLTDMQKLLRNLKQLKKTRGEKAAGTQGSNERSKG